MSRKGDLRTTLTVLNIDGNSSTFLVYTSYIY